MKTNNVVKACVISCIASVSGFSYHVQYNNSLHNPGNIMKTKQHWEGQASDLSHERRVHYSTQVYGYRAMAKTILTYYKKYNCDTVTKIVFRYAPPNENPTQAYIQYVAHEAGFTTWSHLALEKEIVLFDIVKAMAKFEQGYYFHDDDSTIMLGVRKALNGT